MLERIGTSGYESISKPSAPVLTTLASVTSVHPIVGEVGVGIGATTLEVAKKLNNHGEIHIFDFTETVELLDLDLRLRGFTNIVRHGNSRRYWDSYHWSLAKVIDVYKERFDLLYIDGAHTYLHDALAFLQCDRLLKIGAFLIFDDYYWRYSRSKFMKGVRDQYMTSEQIQCPQIKMIVDTFVKPNLHYKELIPNRVYEKTGSMYRKPNRRG